MRAWTSIRMRGFQLILNRSKTESLKIQDAARIIALFLIGRCCYGNSTKSDINTSSRLQILNCCFSIYLSPHCLRSFSLSAHFRYSYLTTIFFCFFKFIFLLQHPTYSQKKLTFAFCVCFVYLQARVRIVLAFGFFAILSCAYEIS